MHKVKYEVDPHNRLVIDKTGKKSDLSRFRRVVDGRFKTGPNNSLIYHVKSPIQGVTQDLKAPHQVKLRGNWSLTKNHDLRLTLDKWRRQIPGDELTLQGEIIGHDASSLLFAVTTKTKEKTASTYILKLEGTWQADEDNRLTFRVKKGVDSYDTLTFDGIWEIDKNHQIIYHYEKAQLKRKEKLKKTLTFKGFWNITEHNRLSYQLDLEGRSIFNFQTTLGLLEKDSIKYEVGIGTSRKKRPVRRVVTLFGTWKIKRNIGLIFEIEYEKCKPQAITFGADARLNEKDNIEFKLKNEFGKDLGMKLILSRKLLKGDGEVFLRLLKSQKEAAIYIGAGWMW